MSISLPNGTILAPPSASGSNHNVSAAVTRILHLSKFPPELKTRDLQTIFKDWEGEKGGFRIKWVDDVNALVVFADATVAKRAYLSLLLNPHPTFPPPAQIRPYDRPDAALIIQSLAARSMGHRALQSSSINLGNVPPSDTQPNANGIAIHSRAQSVSNPGSINSIMGGFKMPLLPSSTSSSSISGPNGHSRGTTAPAPNARVGGGVGGGAGGHQRSGSASSSWARSGGGGGALNFSFPPSSSGANRLPTHTESADPSRSSSASSADPIVLLDTNAPAPAWNGGRGAGNTARRESVTADKAMREVEKALASVEAKG